MQPSLIVETVAGAAASDQAAVAIIAALAVSLALLAAAYARNA